MTMPTQAQMDQVAQQAVSAFAAEMQISEADAITNHSDAIFHMVCAFAAQAAA
jgi:hypothetical protein